MFQETPSAPRTLVELLRRQAERHRDKVAFSFSRDGDDENASRLTYRELDLQARAVAASLQRQGAAGERVLVLWRPGLDCLAAYFGCLYAGAVPVPVDEQWASRRVATVVPDARAGFALATPATRAKIKTTVDGLVDRDSLRWCSTDVAVDEADNWVAPDVDADTTAMVQYTSGSTRTPRGIVLTHDNLLHNLRLIRQAWDPDFDDPLFNNPAGGVTGVFWLPHHHDMGLIGGVLAPIDAGFTVALMAPGAFLMRPMGWLKAMSRHRAAVSAAPNFAFDLCVKRSTPEQRAELDLSNWSIAITGGEPVRAETLRAFADAFAPAGFKPEAFLPAYGLAEATLGVSGVSDSPAPVVQHIDRTALEGDRVVEAEPDDDGAVALVGCGRPRGGQTVVIVDPETRRLRRDDEVGEVWISGPCVAAGYWDRPDETEQTFESFLAADPDRCPDRYPGPYLRTGDLGFFRFGEVFITGRCKDLVIIRGSNYYPNDIEMTVQDCHPVLLAGRGAVFSVNYRRRLALAEQLIVVQEVDRHLAGEVDLGVVVDAIRAAIKKHHGIEADAVVLVKPMRIPTTSSGKIQRGQCRQQFVDEALEPLAQWHAPPPPVDHSNDGKRPEVALKLAGVVAKGLLRQHRTSRQR